MPPNANRLNLGCGTDIRPGYVNLDAAPLRGVDVVHDLDSGRLPFEDAAFVEVLCQDVLEHVDYVPLLGEVHRVLAPGGRVRIRSPHFTSRAVWLDPTHRAAFSVDTLRFFAEGAFADRDYYFPFRFRAVESARITFHRYRGMPWNYVVEPLVNRSHAVQAYYEGTFLAHAFPASNVEVVLVR